MTTPPPTALPDPEEVADAVLRVIGRECWSRADLNAAIADALLRLAQPEDEHDGHEHCRHAIYHHGCPSCDECDPESRGPSAQPEEDRPPEGHAVVGGKLWRLQATDHSDCRHTSGDGAPGPCECQPLYRLVDPIDTREGS